MPVTVKGADRLEATMAEAGVELGRMGEAHRDVAALIVRAARPPRRTGRLAASIRPVPDALSAQVEATAPYAAVIEYGSRVRGIRAQPYLAPAVESTTGRWLDVYRDGVQDILDDVKGA